MKLRLFSNAALFLRVLAFAAAVPYLLRLKLSTVARVIESEKNPSVLSEGRVGKIVAYVERAIRHGRPLVRPGCLTRGVTRYYFLRRAGMDVARVAAVNCHHRDTQQSRSKQKHTGGLRCGGTFLQ